MLNRVIVVFVAVFLVLSGYIVCVCVWEKLHSPVVVDSEHLHFGHIYQVKTIKVLRGDSFDVVLEDGKRYLVDLVEVYGTPPEAKELVTRYLNDCREKGDKPFLIPHGWNYLKEVYSVDLFPEKEHSMSQWLYEHNLAYSK